MKKIIAYFFAFVLFLGMGGCKKGDLISDPAALTIGSYITLVKSNNTRIDYSNLSTSKVSITVREFGTPVDKIKVHVTKGSSTTDRSQWKFVKEFTYSGETTLEVSATEIAAALGIPVTGLEPGVTYTLYNQIIAKDGRIFDIANTFGEFAGFATYNMVLTWAAVIVCPFVAPMAGDYTVIQDDWVDWSPGDIVKITDGPDANQINISKVWPNPAFGDVVAPLVVSVDPATGTATIPDGVTWGDYGSYKAVTGTGSTGFVFSCTGRVALRIHILAPPFGDQGFFNLVLQKI